MQPATDTGDTRHLFIEFFLDAVENQNKSRKEGRPVYDEREFVRIKFVGDPKRIHVAPAHEKFWRDPSTNTWVSYAERYHKHYDAFKTGEAVKGSGTPLEELHFINVAKRAELKALNIHTAEALAQMDGAALARVGMYGRSLKTQAQAYLDSAAKTAPFSKLAEENAALVARIQALEAQMATGKPAAPAVSDDAMADRIEDAMAAEAEARVSRFNNWSDADLKAFIKDRTKKAPQGQPSHATLVRMAEEANQQEEAA